MHTKKRIIHLEKILFLVQIHIFNIKTTKTNHKWDKSCIF